MLDHSLESIRNQQEQSGSASRQAKMFANSIRPAKASAPIGPASSPAARARRRPPRRRLELSLTQILGSTAAAVTAAFLGSRLGVAGTLIGAALASVISVVGGAIYTSSLKATKLRVAKAIVAVRNQDEDEVRSLDDRARAARLIPSPPTPRAPVAGQLGSPGRAGHPAVPGVRRPRRSGNPGGPGKHLTLRGVVVGGLLSAAVFALALTIVTGYESVSGESISGGQAGSLTVLGGQHNTDDRTRTTVTETTTAKPTQTSTTSPGSSQQSTSGTPTSAVTTSGQTTATTPTTSTPTSGTKGAVAPTTGATPSTDAAPTTDTAPTSDTAVATSTSPAPTASSTGAATGAAPTTGARSPGQ